MDRIHLISRRRDSTQDLFFFLAEDTHAVKET